MVFHVLEYEQLVIKTVRLLVIVPCCPGCPRECLASQIKRCFVREVTKTEMIKEHPMLFHSVYAIVSKDFWMLYICLP